MCIFEPIVAWSWIRPFPGHPPRSSHHLQRFGQALVHYFTRQGWPNEDMQPGWKPQRWQPWWQTVGCGCHISWEWKNLQISHRFTYIYRQKSTQMHRYKHTSPMDLVELHWYLYVQHFSGEFRGWEFWNYPFFAKCLRYFLYRNERKRTKYKRIQPMQNNKYWPQ